MSLHPTNDDFQAICDPDLLRKYDVAGPRYTSYPTAAQFTADFDRNSFLEHALQRSKTSPLSLYFHLPFCHSICYYCACNKIVTRDRSQSGIYLDYLEKEMALLKQQLGWEQRPVSQLHWGGGTPTFLSDEEMRRLVGSIREHFNLLGNDQEREYSIEIDPRTVDTARLQLLWELGFNRVSLGIQDFNSDVQNAVNRFQDYDTIVEQVNTIRSIGYESINFDLIYGLPFQTEATVKETIRQVIELSPDRISCYNYAHLPERFKSQRSIDRQRLPSADEKIRLIATVINDLMAAGYVYVGMDHFVKPNDTLAQALRNNKLQRNFQGYSLNLAEDMLSLGVSSISDFSSCYAQNFRKLESYYQALDQGLLPIEHGVAATADDLMRRDIIQQVTCHRFLDIPKLEQKYQLNFKEHFADSLQKLQPLADDGIIDIRDDAIVITTAGFLFLRHVAMAFDIYMGKPNPAGARYSKTI